jgi:hypothetical protein
MNVGAITAVCAILIALASLAVAIMEARATREHNRQSVKPVLRTIRVKAHDDQRTGLKLRNVGLGPAVVVGTSVRLDGNLVGSWDRDTFDLLVASNRPIPKFSTLYNKAVIPAGEEQFLIFIDRFRENRHSWFWELIAYRLTLEIRYESLYGGENFVETKEPR